MYNVATEKRSRALAVYLSIGGVSRASLLPMTFRACPVRRMTITRRYYGTILFPIPRNFGASILQHNNTAGFEGVQYIPTQFYYAERCTILGNGLTQFCYFRNHTIKKKALSALRLF